MNKIENQRRYSPVLSIQVVAIELEGCVEQSSNILCSLQAPDRRVKINYSEHFVLQHLGSGTSCLLKLEDLTASKLSKQILLLDQGR